MINAEKDANQLQNILIISLVALAYLGTGLINFSLLSHTSIISIGIFIPEGVALAAAIYFKKRALPGILIGQFLLAYQNGLLPIAAVEISIINTIEAFIGLTLFKKLQISKELLTFPDILKLAALIFFILQPFSAIVSNTALLLHHQTQSQDFIYLTFSWWFGNVLGQFLMTPLLLLFFHNYKKINFIDSAISTLIYFVVLYFLSIVLQIQNPFLLMGITIAITVFIIIEQDKLHALLFIFIAAILASYSVHLEIGAFSSRSALDNTLNYDLYILSHIVIVWLVGILFEERKRYEESLHTKISEALQINKEQEYLMLQQNRLAQMGELISMIAHQWRQPLNNLHLVNQSVISKYRREKLNEEAMQYFEKNSQQQIEYMSDTINDFRNFFSIEEEKQYFSLNEVTKNVIKIIKPILVKNSIAVHFHVSKEFSVFGHENFFTQVLLNIINNAKDALCETNIIGKKIEIDIYQLKGEILLSIEDNGGGIDPSIIEQIFDPYFSTKKSKNGTGLGLYMSKMIIHEQMGGTLSVYNGAYGAKFIISMSEVQK